MLDDDRDMVWATTVAALLLVTHAIAYMTHEYSHSTLAWALGWMRSPLALDYGQPTLGNLLLLSDVSDNVDYAPIMARGHGLAAAGIALAGPFVGNGLLYFAVYALARRSASSGGQAFAFCLALMCAGNVWSYVPVRALTTHADIAIAARGLGVGPGALFPFVLAPALAITWHFFRRGCRWWLPIVAGASDTRRAVACALTGFWFFVFFGGAARDGGYGAVSQALSLLSIYLLFPVCVIRLWSQSGRSADRDPERIVVAQ